MVARQWNFMRHYLLPLIAIIGAAHVSAQTCDFDTPDWGLNITTSAGATAVVQSGSPYWPVGTTYGVNGSQALCLSGGTVEVDMEPIDTRNHEGSYLQFRLAALAETGTGKGMDLGTDYVEVLWKTNPALPWEMALRIKGYNNAYWSIHEHGVSYQLLANRFQEITPLEGGYNLHGAPNRFILDDLPKTDSLMIRFIFYSDRSNEVWAIDDIELRRPFTWTNQSGDGSASNSLNWTPNGMPSSVDALFMNDSLIHSPWSGSLSFKRLITDASDTLDLSSYAMEVGDWYHRSGFARTDSTLILTESMGHASIVGERGQIVGYLGVKHLPQTLEGWRHFSTPVRTYWSDVTNDISNVIYGINGSIFGWDPGNAAWFTLNNGSYITKGNPVTLFAGANWLDSSNVIHVSGGYATYGDTAWLDYGIPTINSPFATTVGNEGWNFIGNPFPFPLNLDSVFASPDWPVTLAPTAYIWSTGSQQYRSYNATTGSFGGATPHIHPWQGFWVQFSSDPGQPQQFPLLPGMGGEVSGDHLQKQPLETTRFRISSGSDSTRVHIVDMYGQDERWEPEYDHKWRSNGALRAFLLAKDSAVTQRVTVKSLAPSLNRGIPLVIQSDFTRNFKIDLLENKGWWLEDRSLGRWYDLSKTPVTGQVLKGQDSRFYLWRKRPLSLDEDRRRESDVPTYLSGKISNDSGEEWTLFDMTGRKVLQIKPHSELVHILEFGVYVWRSSSQASKVVIRSTVQ